MTICVMLITLSLLEGFLTRRIPEYDLCIENCGDPLLEDPVELHKVFVCSDKCNEDELKRCKGSSKRFTSLVQRKIKNVV
ncbi:hypothetical protein CRM22_010943 [Opisthorchis felineus]|uniref:Uncharacterized protein n=1 Tax=Opisthorchis felineus TaxID=147828 RepID=A0A4S2KH62_OPIFE|nr:hypothetical protein CRM22_010943 [Opisthorchis felineus]